MERVVVTTPITATSTTTESRMVIFGKKKQPKEN